MRPSTFATRAALALLLTLLAACGGLSDVLSPGRPEPYQQVPARVALAAQLPSFTRGLLASPQLRVVASYARTDGKQVTLATLALPLQDVTSQTLPLAIDLSPCLVDPLREGADQGSGRSAVCLVSLQLTLLDGERVIDQQTVGPLRLLPGSTSTVADPVSLFEVAGVRVVPPAGTPDGTVRLERGRTLALTAAVTSTTGQVVAGRAVQWTSSAPAVAQVDPVSGVVTALTTGRVRISATTGAQVGGIDLNVVPPPSAITVTALTPAVGSGQVKSSPAGIDCRVANGQATGTCTATFLGDAQVTLTATADAGSAFGSWGGACAGVATGPTCVLPADQPRSASVAFTAQRTLSVGSAVAADDAGAGRVSSAPAGIDCQISGPGAAGSCSAPFADGQAVTLTAEPTGQSAFLGWSGDCAGTMGPVCTVTLAGGNRNVQANFGAPVRLSIGITGAGGGAVSVVVNGQTTLLCGTGGAQQDGCVATLPIGTIVTLVATPDAGSTFAGWTGACTGTGTCRVTVDQARSVGAVFTRRTITLTLSLGGAGGGTVQVNGQTSCSLVAGQGASTCRATVDAGTSVTLTAAPGLGSGFSAWGGACTGSTGTTCTLTPQTDQTIGASFFRLPNVVLAVQPGASSSGTGTITSAPAGITCSLGSTGASGSCSSPFLVGTSVTLTAAPSANSTFGGWAGACSGTAPTCVVAMDAAKTVQAIFNIVVTSPLTVSISGNGNVTSTPGGIACPSTCTAGYPIGTIVTLTAAPGAGSTFAGWSGACSGTSPTCVVAVNLATGVGAAFATTGPTFTLTVATTGAAGTVTSSPGGISCPTACTANYASRTVVTLTATPGAGGTFLGWSGACTGTGSCVVTMSAAQSVTAAFSGPTFGLAVTLAGNGVGTVTSSPGGISCPTTCTAAYAGGTTVTLTAAATGSSTFAGWSGACSGTGPCQVLLNQARSVTATFTAVTVPVTLVVDPISYGSGQVVTVNATPALNCTFTVLSTSGTCTASYPVGTTLTLAAGPAINSAFRGWSGPCTGAAPTCTFVVTAATTASARFDTQTLHVDLVNAGVDGTVAVSIDGVAQSTCSVMASSSASSCNYIVPRGSTVTLSASPANFFQGSWDAPCDPSLSTQTTCVFTFNFSGPISVAGNFGPGILYGGSAPAGLRAPARTRRWPARPSSPH